MHCFKFAVICLLCGITFNTFGNEKIDLRDPILISEELFHKDAPHYCDGLPVTYVTDGITLFPNSKKYPRNWGFAFMSRDKLTAEEAASLVARVHERVYQEVNKEKIHAYHLNESGRCPNVSSSRLNVRITFWDENYDRIYPPYIGQADIYENEIYLYEADPGTERLKSSFLYGQPVKPRLVNN